MTTRLAGPVILTALLLAQPLLAQHGNDGHAGYQDIPDFGGPESVSGQLRSGDEVHAARFDENFLDRYFDWKRRINEDYDLSFGVHLFGLYQQASDSLPGRDDDAMGNIFRLLGSWTLFGRDGRNPGRLEWRLERRSSMLGFQAPNSLGSATGIAALSPGFVYSENFEMDVSVLNWTQDFADSRGAFAAGRLAFTVYLDSFPFQTISKGLVNRSFILNPTVPTTGVGALGGVAKSFVSDRVWIGAQIHDANAVSGKFDLDTVREGEWLKAVEIGYTPSFARKRERMIQLTYWDKDARSLAGVSRGRGWAVSAAWKLDETFFPFVRFGKSDGGGGVLAEEAVSAGVEVSRSNGDAWTLGASWARPSADTFGTRLDPETAFETSYTFQVSSSFSLLPDVQVIFNPANNPDRSSIWVLGIRARLTL